MEEVERRIEGTTSSTVRYQVSQYTSEMIPNNQKPLVNWNLCRLNHFCTGFGKEVEDAVFDAKRWDCRNRAELIESSTPCYDAQVVGPYLVSISFRQTVLISESQDLITVPQHLWGRGCTPCSRSSLSSWRSFQVIFKMNLVDVENAIFSHVIPRWEMWALISSATQAKGFWFSKWCRIKVL